MIRSGPRIVISLLSLRLHRTGGVETYLRELLAHLPAVLRNEQIQLLAHRDLAGVPEFEEFPLTIVDASERQIYAQRALEAFTPYRALSIERQIAALQPDVVLFPQQVVFPKRTPFRKVVVVHDLAELFHPQFFSWRERAYRRAMHSSSIHAADRVISVSQDTAHHVVNHYGVPRARISVIPHGMHVRATSVAPLTADVRELEPFLYYPASTHPHKNHHGLLHTIARLKSADNFPYRLVLTGVRTRYWDNLLRMIRDLGLSDVVHHLGYVAPEMVLALYRAADAVVYPSLFEGFGLPVVEARSVGKKIIVSKLAVYAEHGVPEDFCIDFSDPEQLLRTLSQPKPSFRAHPPWLWSQCARATLDELCHVAGREGMTHSALAQRKAA